MVSSTASSRSQSTSSISSVNSAYKDLSETARTILNSLCNERDLVTAKLHVSAAVIVQHDDNPPLTTRDAYFQGWTQALERMPEFRMEIKEACVDEAQRKVWVRSEITGFPNGVRKESIDMMSFDQEGMLASSVDCQRVIRKRDNDDD